jgi:hypothetical protein
VGYVLTSEEQHRFRDYLQRASHVREAMIKSGALDLLGILDRSDGLDSERLHELATWAREQARHAPIGGSRTLAEHSRIIEISTDVLTALALDKFPPGAVLDIGRDEEQVNAKPTRLRWPSKAERAAAVEPGAGDAMFLRIGTNLGLVDELAANGKMSRAQVEALPSHDRVVLGQILATLRAEPLTREPLDGPAVDVLVEFDQYMHNVDTEFDALRRAAAPRYSLPESHPLRQYQWAEWLAALIRREEAVEGSDYITGAGERLPVLREALTRVQSHDLNGLRGLYADSGEFWPDENVLLQVALGLRGAGAETVEHGGALARGCHRVPRARGETAEVGK